MNEKADKSQRALTPQDQVTEFLLYTAPSGGVKVEVIPNNETIWLTQQRMADLFGVQRPAITKHLKNIFDSNELQEEVVCSILEHTTQHGAITGKNQAHAVKYYNLDAVISVGYRVNSSQATQFRIWATQLLREYIIKGYTLDDDRLKNGRYFGKDYFEDLMELVRSIRASERRFYQKITDIYITSVDYNKDDPTTREFFAKVKNKLHYAIHGHTAVEVIKKRADSTKSNMGLSTWGNSPKGKIRASDVAVAENYLSADELRLLGRIVNAYLDLAEDRAKRRIPMTMEDWASNLDKFLVADGRDVLQEAGSISTEVANDHAMSEFEKYRVIQDRLFESDFDMEVKAIKKKLTKHGGSNR
ncbi:MAG: virulence RhuM family protein [Pseudohongiellaceae bacterium]